MTGRKAGEGTEVASPSVEPETSGNKADVLPHGLRSLAFLSKILDHVDGDSLHELEDRIVIQKKLYLAQNVFGVDLGYDFKWNMFGPFSKELARECTSLQAYLPMVKEIAAPLRLRTEVAQGLEEVRSLMPPAGLDISKGAWLELLGSLHMLARFAYRGTLISSLSAVHREQVEQDLLLRKPYFEPYRARFAEVWEVLSKGASSSEMTGTSGVASD
jgi:hypothetical protein